MADAAAEMEAAAVKAAATATDADAGLGRGTAATATGGILHLIRWEYNVSQLMHASPYMHYTHFEHAMSHALLAWV